MTIETSTRTGITALAALGVFAVGYVDYATGYEVSMSLFYIGPVALAAWYAGRSPGIAIAVLSCVAWFAADNYAGHLYSNPAFPYWNALVRLGVFLITGLLLSALRASLRYQQHLASTDSLTGLYGRRAFEERLAHDLALARRRASAVSLAYIDLDDFKRVNDLRGHAAGDRVLKATARVLMDSVRLTDTAARLGGDEFALLLPDTDGAGAQRAVDNVARALRTAFDEGEPGVSCSIGVVTFADAELPPAQAIAAADALMFEVKRQGKGAVAFRVRPAGAAP